ncbi:hypothetical protein [Flexivirga lutea]
MTGRRPPRAYDGMVVALWPDLGEDDPHSYDLDSMYGRLVTDHRLNLMTGEWEPIPASTTRPLLRIVCDGEHNRLGSAPMLAELWHTDRGPFFISKLPGAVTDPPNDPDDPFAPPSAVLPPRLRRERRAQHREPAPSQQWHPVPITIVRLFLQEPATERAHLWVKCADHGPATIDRALLYKAHLEDQARRRAGHDTPQPMVIPLHDVRTLS